MMDWLLLPLSGATVHVIEPWAYWHARCMVLAWGVLLPLGVLAARYFKVMPRQAWPAELDNRAWWHAHRALNWAGVALMSLGTWLALRHAQGADFRAALHTLLGWTVVGLGWCQIALGFLRGSKGGPTSDTLRGDHYDMSPRRRWFERLHKTGGWLSVLLAVPTTLLGLWMVDAPRWMGVCLVSWWAVLALAVGRLQHGGRCIDTYQAIWGPDLKHPGNLLEPIGWGVHRPVIRTLETE